MTLPAFASDFWLPFGVLLVGAAVTYAWRGLGVALSGRLDTDSPLFVWVSCVAYALLAALIARMIVLPFGLLAETATLDRVLAALIALAVFFAARRNILLGALGGSGSLVLMVWLRGIPL
ncbi:AzlD domain-containing protein [Algihabitans albus]|uniref:AzlD domain-containing protein n=1 Tax=Algihabitans albus TaxID=2164067 RepID=UPI000E5C8034|nr:AzlD domain-containing protein [Algihabitans albus]